MSHQRNLTMARAGREAVIWEMHKNPDIFMIGEDVATFGGVFGTADGLGKIFGPERIIDTPISETGFIGLATGAAMGGMRPIVELAYIDFIGVCFNAIANLAAKTHYMSGGQIKVPMVLMVGVGAGYNNAAQHSQVIYSLLAHMPGMKVVMPSNAYDAKGMMHTALRDDNFTIFLINKNTAGIGFLGRPIQTTINSVPEEDYTVPFGKANIVREGSDVSLIGLGWTLHESLKAADMLAEKGVSAEVVDVRSLVPLDRETILGTVQKTGRLVVSDEDYLSFGLSGEVVASVVERDHTALKAPAQRVCFPDVPIPFAREMEDFCLPYADKIVAAALRTLEGH